jgi:hypothetical protein
VNLYCRDDVARPWASESSSASRSSLTCLSSSSSSPRPASSARVKVHAVSASGDESKGQKTGSSTAARDDDEAGAVDLHQRSKRSDDSDDDEQSYVVNRAGYGTWQWRPRLLRAEPESDFGQLQGCTWSESHVESIPKPRPARPSKR